MKVDILEEQLEIRLDDIFSKEDWKNDKISDWKNDIDLKKK